MSHLIYRCLRTVARRPERKIVVVRTKAPSSSSLTADSSEPIFSLFGLRVTLLGGFRVFLDTLGALTTVSGDSPDPTAFDSLFSSGWVVRARRGS